MVKKILHVKLSKSIFSKYVVLDMARYNSRVAIFLVALSISLVPKSLVDLPTILFLLYGTHFLVIFIRFLTSTLHHYLFFLHHLLFPTKNSKPTCFIGLFVFEALLATCTDRPIFGTELDLTHLSPFHLI